MRSDYYDGGDLARAADRPVNMPETIYVGRGVLGYVVTQCYDPIALPYRRIDLVRPAPVLPPLWWLLAGVCIGFVWGSGMSEPHIDMELAAAAKVILDPLEGMDYAKAPMLGAAIAFGSAASNRALSMGNPDAAAVAFARAFLRVLIDPLDEVLDPLRQDPSAGPRERAKRMKRGA